MLYGVSGVFSDKLLDNKALLPGTVSVSEITVLNDCYSFELNLNKSSRAYARV